MVRFLRGSKQTEHSDDELLERYYQKKDLADVAILFDRYLEYIYGICLKYCKKSDISKDLTMEVFESLPDKMAKHRISNFKSWLYVVVKNHCLGHLGKQKKNISAPLTDLIMHSPDLMHHDDDYDVVEEFAGLYACVGRLPQKQRQCIELFYFAGNSYQEIASVLAEEKDKVRSYIQNGRRNLKNCLEKNSADGIRK